MRAPAFPERERTGAGFALLKNPLKKPPQDPCRQEAPSDIAERLRAVGILRIGRLTGLVFGVYMQACI